MPWMWAALAMLLLWAPGSAHADDLKDGRAALQAGRLDDAIKSFERAAAQGLAEGRAGVGQVWLKRHQYANAMEAFQLAQKMDGNLGLAYYGQGEVLRQQEKYAEAVPLLQKAVELDRKFPEAQLSLSASLTALKRFDEAVTAANRGLGWGSKWRPKFLVALGDVSLARDSLRDAGIWYTNAVQEAPDDPTTLRALGDFYVKRGTFELAYPEFQKAVAKDSADVDLHFALARALDYGGRANDALQEYRWVVARNPEYAAGQLALGSLLYRAGRADPRRYAESREPLEKYTQLEPSNGRGWGTLGRTYYHVGMKDEALAALNKAEALGDSTKDNFRIRARIWTERRDLEKANADYARVGDSSDMSPDDAMRMAQMMVIQKNTAKAESLYGSIIDADSTTKAAQFSLGEIGKIRFRDKDYPGAIGWFQRRIALDPANDEAYYYIGLSYKEMGKYPEALEALGRAASGTGESKPERHFWFGILQQQLKNEAAAATEFQKAVDLDSVCGNQKALALRQLGYFKLLAKQPADAVGLLDRSVQCNDKDFQSWVWLGQGHQNSGNRSKAAEAYRKALALKPGQPEAEKGLKLLSGGAK